MQSQKTKILQNLNTRIDHVKKFKHPDIVLIEKKNQETFTDDVVRPQDFCVKDKEAEYISKQQDLALEISPVWNTITRVIPMVIGALEEESLLTEYIVYLWSNGQE